MSTTLSTPEILAAAYRRLASIGYRPAAPSDGFGNITVPIDSLDLDAEAEAYARQMAAEDEAGDYNIGHADYRDRVALVLAIEGARLIAGGDLPRAATLLRMAANEIERNTP